MKKFRDFFLVKENVVPSEIKLNKDSDFKPFHVDATTRKNLRPIIKAFIDSPNVELHGQKFVAIDKKGPYNPKLKKKSLYLTGGAVRDHLLDRTPRDYDLTTDASVDEVRRILTHAGFKEIKPKTNNKKYDKLPEKGHNKTFFVKDWDKEDNEFAVTITVNKEEFDLYPLHKNPKGITPEKLEFSSLEDDSLGRDLTINSMYIPLNNPDGANTKLIDPHGGSHHIKDKLQFIGNPQERLEEDPHRLLRYIRFASAFEPNKDYDKYLDNFIDYKRLNPEELKTEFQKGLKNPDVDINKFIKMYKKSGLLNKLFPQMDFSDDFIDERDKKIIVAWILRKNDPQQVEDTLEQAGMSFREIKDISTLIRILNWCSKFQKEDDQFLDDFYDIKEMLPATSLVPSLIKKWGKLNKTNPNVLDKLLKHEDSPLDDEFDPEDENLVKRVHETDKFAKDLYK